MTRDELLQLHETTCNNARELMKIKNSDYGADNDPFRNFHWFGSLGIIVRLSDKIARLRTFLEKAKLGQDMAVKDEGWIDTIDDGINYLILLKAYVLTNGVE